MKIRLTLALAALLMLSACNLVPAASPLPPTAKPLLPTATRIPLTATPLPGLVERFGERQIILDRLVVQGAEVAIPAGVEASILFSSQGRASGSGGCNRYSGGFENPAPGQVKFAALISTKMYCQEKMTVESGLFQVLAKVTRYRVENIRLILESEDGQYLARFHDLVK